MSKLGINTGTTPNDKTGDTLLDAVVKINQNFNEIYTTFGDGTNLSSYVSISGYSTSSGVSTSATTSGYATIAGYSTSSGVSTSATTSGYATIAGIATYASTAGIATYASTAGIATALQNSRTFEITGDIVASPISFNGTGNVSLAATIQPNSVALGTDTTGDYVLSVSGTSNQITVTSGTGEGSAPTLSIPSQFTAPQDVTVTRDLQVNRNLNVNGNITVGGTSATLFTTEFKVYDPDIVLGFRTDGSGNDVSNDTTANHGGIAIASTEGTPLISLYDVGIGETNPATYKKIMWFKSGTFSGLGTDVWLSNYAVGIGSTQVPNGVRLAAGAVQFTERDLLVVRNINASGVITASSFSGSGTNLTGISTFTNGPVFIGAATSTGTASQTLQVTGGAYVSGSVGIGTTNPLTRLDLNGGTLSFGKKASNIGDISIGNTSTSLGYAGLGEFLNPYYQNNVFVGNNIFQNRANTNLPGYNVIIGDRAGNTLGDGCNENVIIGRDAGFVNRGSGNNFIGNRTGQSNTTGYFNVFLGYNAGNFNTTGFYNTFIGNEAGYRNTIGNNNFYGGQFSGYFNQGGKFNLALGDSSANGFDGSNTTYDSNIHLGSVNGSVIGGSYQILIGSGNDTGSRYFNLPDPNKNYQFAVGIRTDVNPSKYWLVGNENFNVGIGTTLPTSKLHVIGDARIVGVVTATTFVGDGSQLTGITASGGGTNLGLVIASTYNMFMP